MKMDPVVCRQWVGETLMKAFPLGVFRDRRPELPVDAKVPVKTIAEALGIEEGKTTEPTTRRHHHTRDLTLKIAGFGGQGILLMGQLLAEMGLREQMEVSWLPSYGPEMRSGSAHCHVSLSHDRIGSPLISQPEVLIAMNELSLHKFAATVASGGLILYNSTKLPEGFSAPQARIVCVPASEIADGMGSAKVANVVMLGALLEETECLPTESAISVLEATVKNPKLLELDRTAITAGRDYVDTKIEVGAVSQPDGYSY
jgi:2-oxoisovalerate ferredoxin oxidoreductase beta subunit